MLQISRDEHFPPFTGAREGAWPADQVERWPIDRLIPYPNNSRTHSDAQIAQLAASMKELGWTNPVLADEVGGIDAQKRAYVLADNKLALNAGWERELLGLELGELKLGGFDLALTGFGELELGDLLADRTQGLTDPDVTTGCSLCELTHVAAGPLGRGQIFFPCQADREPSLRWI